MSNFSDQQLLKGYFTGSHHMFDVLVERYLSLVYGICLRYLQSRSEAEDATQEIFVKVWKNLKRFTQQKSFSSWVAEIAKNTCLDALKKKRVVPFSAFETPEGTNFLNELLVSPDLLPPELA